MSKEDKRLKSMPSSTKSQSGIPLPSPRYNAESEIPPSLTLFIAIRVRSPEFRTQQGAVLSVWSSRVQLGRTSLRSIILLKRREKICDRDGHVKIRQRETVGST